MFAQPQHGSSGPPPAQLIPAKPAPLASRTVIAASSRSGGSDLNEQLVAVADNRDRAAFAGLYGHFAPRVKAFMLKRGCDSAMAEEIAQMTLAAVWEKAAQFRPEKASAATWIFTIARNLHIDIVRKSRRPEPDPDDPYFVQNTEKAADDSIADAQDAARLRSAIASLPSEQQEVLRLSFYEEKTHSEISSALDLPLGTVKSRLRLAFGRIRKDLGDLR